MTDLEQALMYIMLLLENHMYGIGWADNEGALSIGQYDKEEALCEEIKTWIETLKNRVD